MTALRLPAKFENSYKAFESYPSDLVCQTSYLYAIDASKKRLDTATTKLFNTKDAEIKVPIRESLPMVDGFRADTKAFKKENIYNDDELKAWLGDTSDSPGGSLATKKDPKCRFIYLHAANSLAALNVTRKMLLRILSYHQVMPAYLDFISVFGSQDDPKDLRFSGFREQTLITQELNPLTENLDPRGPAVPELSRSGHQFQLCYNLKAVACTSPLTATKKDKTWSIRQTAFHHQFDVETGTSLWIVTKGNLQMRDRVEEMTGQKGNPEDRNVSTLLDSFRFSLKIHILFCHWSTEEWRWYLQWLEEMIDLETRMAKDAPRLNSKLRYLYSPDELQRVQDYEDKTNEAVMILEANVDIINSLSEYYERLTKSKAFTIKESSTEDVVDFAIKLKDMVYDLRMQISRGKLLAKITADRKTLILQHLQSQATEKMEIMTSMSQREAVAVRIITVVTLIYLPATFVSTFFSTDIVKYQGQGNEGGSFSDTALYRWLQIALPLTVLTLGISFAWYEIAETLRIRKQVLPYSSKDIKKSNSWMCL